MLPKSRVLLCVFCVQNDSLQRILTKKCFQFTVGSVYRVMRFTTGSRPSFKGGGKSQLMPDHVGKRLRQQSKDFCAAGFDALVKRWDTWRICGEINVFSSSFEYHMSYVLHVFVTYVLTPFV
jgi:hypothetical protein